ncbi:MAG: hypothetical protein K2X00_15745 [Nitrospiraceae bacterium]|nr:hypothetical protein [Nitrospiraceae bacterium]
MAKNKTGADSHVISSVLTFFAIILIHTFASGEDPGHHHGNPGTMASMWEGSPQGKAYSEFNHHIAGVFVILIALSEFLTLAKSLAWIRFLLPVAMLAAGSYLIIWSDHDAWPIGPRGIADTFFVGAWETIQHKVYAILLLAVGSIELLRRLGRIRLTVWSVPLPVFAIAGGMMLFLHSHGPHPSAHTIVLHHTVMGTMAVAAGICKLIGDNSRRLSHPDQATSQTRNAWEFAWASFILFIGLQLIIYTE